MARQSIAVDHIVDAYNRFPGDPVTFYTYVKVAKSIKRASLSVTIPQEIELQPRQVKVVRSDNASSLVVDPDGCRALVWPLEEGLERDKPYEFQISAKIAAVESERRLKSVASLLGQDGEMLASKAVTIKVLNQSNYLRYLPAIFETQDRVMGRLLMLFESYLARLEARIETMAYLLDPKITPENFLPWLGSWLDLSWSPAWPDDRFRELIQSALELQRRQGTPWALQKSLKIYTGAWPQITEYNARNFVVGEQAVLGFNLALGKENHPHTFIVDLTLPPLEIKDENERREREEERRQMIISIIESQKPAHTAYRPNF